jgi:hypothetical protein
MSRWIGALTFVALGCVACGGEAPQIPAGPSSTGVPSSSTQGATIRGNVSAGALPAQAAGMSLTSPVGFASATVPLAAMAAQVVGTPISSLVSTGGGFTLEGVPPGPVQLRFVGSGVDASVALSPVKAGDVVSLLVGVAGATATVQSESRNAGGKVELEGRIESLPPTQADNTLVVDGRTVTTTPGVTTIRDGNNAARSFADLAVGQRVHVKGTLGVDSVVADSILIQNTNTWIPVNVNGIVEVLNTTTPPPGSTFTFRIGSREIRGDAGTKLYGENDVPLTLDSLANGQRVEVKGEQRDNFVYAVRIHINGPTTPEPPQDDSASVEGKLIVIDPAIPLPPAPVTTPPKLTIRSTVGGTTVETFVTTTLSTEVRRRGDVQTLAALAVGQTVHAVGTRMADKSIAARMLQIKDDEPEGAFVIEGSLGGVKGTCPVINFGVNGYTVKTSAATMYYPDVPPPGAKCEDLKSGTKVEVEGKRESDGSVLAVKVTKK